MSNSPNAAASTATGSAALAARANCSACRSAGPAGSGNPSARCRSPTHAGRSGTGAPWSRPTAAHPTSTISATTCTASTSTPWETLHEVNSALIRLVLDALGLPVRIEHSSTISPAGRKTAMLIDLARRTGASVLRVGTSAPRYLDAALLAQASIGVEIISYTHHPYPQGQVPFLPGLAALDLVLHQGPAARGVLAAGVSLRRWEPADSGDQP